MIAAPSTVRETIKWLTSIGRPALPECPIESATVGKEPKQPAYISGWRNNEPFVKPIPWKPWQNTLPTEIQHKVWFQDPKTGVGTLGGWNGRHWLGWVDVDAKDFRSQENCDHTVAEWIENYPVLKEAPRFSTPSGGYRFLIAWDSEPENFKANSKFTLTEGGALMGELLTKNGAHTLLPPTKGLNGEYRWKHWAEYPPVVASPEAVGIYPVKAEVRPAPALAKGSKTDIESAREYLSWIPNNDGVHYDDWLQVGMTLQSVDDTLLAEWKNWSGQSGKHDDGECDRKWASFNSNGGVGIGTLGDLAKANGWVKPQKISSGDRTQTTTEHNKGFDAYLEKLKHLNEIADPIRKGYELFAVSKADGYPLRQIEAALGHYRQRQGSKDKTVFELDEFLDLPFVANAWLIEALVPCGETIILAGAPKEGKTLVAFDAAFSVATNRSNFLGIQPSKKGRVLLISSDESPRSTQARLKKRGFTAEDRGQLRIITRFNLQNLSELRDQLADFQPDLTIVDSLKSISQGSEVSENSAEFADSIYALKELFTQHDSAAILIHHTNKDRDAQGVSQVRGSTAIAGAVWGVFVLKTPRRRQGEEPPKDRWLEINPREGERRTLSIELDPSVNTWTVIGSTEQTSPEQATTKERVTSLLKSMSGKGLEFSEIRDLLPDIKRETLSTCLNRLVDSGIAGKRQSETNYKGWVYWMVSPSVSHGFIPVENMVSSSVSSPVLDPCETDHETEQNGYQIELSEVGFMNVPPRVVSSETNMVSPLVSHGFMEVIENDDDY
jgi:hypothetical protein